MGGNSLGPAREGEGRGRVVPCGGAWLGAHLGHPRDDDARGGGGTAAAPVGSRPTEADLLRLRAANQTEHPSTFYRLQAERLTRDWKPDPALGGALRYLPSGCW